MDGSRARPGVRFFSFPCSARIALTNQSRARRRKQDCRALPLDQYSPRRALSCCSGPGVAAADAASDGSRSVKQREEA